MHPCFSGLWITDLRTYADMKFVLLHETRNDDGIRSFFLDVWELYVKVSRNVRLEVRADASQLVARQCSTRSIRRTRRSGARSSTRGCGRARRSTCERPGFLVPDYSNHGPVSTGQVGGVG